MNDKGPKNAKDVQDLLVYLIGNGPLPKWFQIQFGGLLKRVLMIKIEGFTSDLFDTYNIDLPSLTSFPIQCKLMSPGGKDSCYPLNSALFQTQKKKILHEDKSGEKPGAIFYLASEHELYTNKFPLKEGDYKNGEYSDFVETRKLENCAYKMVALDCEMCLTAEGSKLTRVSVVDENEKVIFDEFCVPDTPITDYLTKYSGITEETLRNVKNRLEDVREKLLNLISSDTIIVGHSLENDLLALKVKLVLCLSFQTFVTEICK